MHRILVVTRDGAEHVLNANIGRSLMEVIREGGIDDLQALCGGCCSCATCHVFVDVGLSDQLAPMTEEESEILEGSSHRAPSSRLSCQVRMTAALDGLRVTISPED